MTEEEKIAYLTDHLAYERLMTEYAFNKISAHQTQLDWNAYYECFGIHARNLYNFLTNGDAGNVRALDYVAGFKAAKNNDTISVFQRLPRQVLHLGPTRDGQKKIEISDAVEVHRWIKENFEQFIAALPADVLKHWKPESIDPGREDVLVVTTGPTGPSGPPTMILNSSPPSATNSPRSITTRVSLKRLGDE